MCASRTGHLTAAPREQQRTDTPFTKAVKTHWGGELACLRGHIARLGSSPGLPGVSEGQRTEGPSVGAGVEMLGWGWETHSAPPPRPRPEAPPPRPFVTAWRAEPAVFPGVPGPGARGRARDRAGAASCAPLLLPGAEASPRRAAEQLKPRRPPPASGNDKPRGSSRPRLRLRYLQPGALWTASRHSG